MYDHTKQYRCEIIRGKSISQIDYLLPAYASVLNSICPCSHRDFETLFNDGFAEYLPVAERKKKTFDNHRTEVSGKLFGMYYYANDGKVYISQRTRKYLKDNNISAFFKDMCYKMQFPNGMQKTKPTVVGKVKDGVRLRPNAFVLKVLLVAEEEGLEITQKAIAYYVLNSLDVLQGKATPYEVLEAIRNDQRDGIIRLISCKDKNGEEKAYSYRYQHIREQLNYLELADLIWFSECSFDRQDKRVNIKMANIATVELFASEWNIPPAFDVYSYDLSDADVRKEFQFDWDLYYSELSEYADSF